MLEGVQDVVLQELLVRDPHLHRLPGRTVLPVPVSQGGREGGKEGGKECSEFSACAEGGQSPRGQAQVRPRLQEVRSRAAIGGLPALSGSKLGHPSYPYQFLTSGMSRARRVRPERKLKGRGAQSRAMPLAVLSV